METSEAAKSMIDGAVAHDEHYRFRWDGRGFQRWTGDEWETVYGLNPNANWSIEAAEGSREWAKSQARAGKLVRQPRDRTVVFGHDSDGFYYCKRGGGMRDRHAPSLAGTGSHCATGWSIWEPEPEPAGYVVRLKVQGAGTLADVVPPTGPGSVLLRNLGQFPDHVVGYIYTLPDGTEVEAGFMRAVWCWEDGGHWRYNHGPYEHNEQGMARLNARPAKLTHVLWWEHG